MTGFIIYFIGCIVAFKMLTTIYWNTPKIERYDHSEACIVYSVGTLASWVTVILIKIARKV